MRIRTKLSRFKQSNLPYIQKRSILCRTSLHILYVRCTYNIYKVHILKMVCQSKATISRNDYFSFLWTLNQWININEIINIRLTILDIRTFFIMHSIMMYTYVMRGQNKTSYNIVFWACKIMHFITNALQ